ncbi:MAG: 2-isopropylmalate synthase [Spirochaetaceae bacterium]|nr:2-isopropylmalate synthase [Spirochaetaceae bacterium]
MAKYNPWNNIPLENRQWPNNTITTSPIWCSVDLRDGNQALAIPMNVEQKLAFFDLLLDIGFKEIEVGFPSSSDTEFTFVRRLIEEKRIPQDVSIQVLCQSRPHLIDKTLEAVQGASKVIFHLYNSTSPAQRKYTFGMSKEEIIDVAISGVEYLKANLHKVSGTEIVLEYSPESFSNTEIDYAVAICEKVKNAWDATNTKKIILNLPETVEYTTPNVFADQVEYFITHIQHPENVIFSVHTHNDRGTGIASAELSLLAGAGRVEGTLFGNGERTGNLDLVALSLNMFAHGIKTGLDFSRLDAIKNHFTQLTSMEVYRRHPYAGDLVFTAFSGSHQDAIRKGLKARKYLSPDAPWDVPYLVIDPRDVGRQYEEIIRVNSQSGKGGAAWLLEMEYGYSLPKGMQIALGQLVKKRADYLQKELSAQEIFTIFEENWLSVNEPLQVLDLVETHLDGTENQDNVLCRGSIRYNNEVFIIGDRGNGPLNAFLKGLQSLDLPYFALTDFSEHSIGSGSDTDAMAYIQLTDDKGVAYWGVGRSANIGRAGINGAVNALNILLKKSTL